MRPNWRVEGARKRGWHTAHFLSEIQNRRGLSLYKLKRNRATIPFSLSLSFSSTLLFLFFLFLFLFSFSFFRQWKRAKGVSRKKARKGGVREKESGARAVVKRELKLRKTFVRKWRSGIETAIFIIENLSRSMVHEIMFPRNDG